MTALTIRLLGSFEARLGGGTPVEFSTKKARALLAYLAFRPGRTHSRDELADLLWATSGDEQARGSLRRTLSDLRKSLGDVGWLVSDGDMLALEPDGTEVDVAAFERLAADGGPAALEQAAALYQGELLTGFGLREQAFEEWLRGERERLRALALDTLGKLLAHCASTNALERGVQTGVRLLAIDPTNEPTHRGLMSLYARQGRRGEALRQYRACCDALMRDLGIRPDPATEALYRELQRPGAVPGQPTKPAKEEFAAPLPLPDKPSIAVLPFANMSGDPEQEFFADGLTEDIITALSRISALWVIARSSTFTYKGKPTEVKRVARELGVRYVMEGSVRRAGDRLRVTALLVDAITGRQVWAERYDRSLADLFDIQDEITRSVAASTETQVLFAERQAAESSPSTDFKARDLVARAWAGIYDQTPEALEESSNLVEEAIRIDPLNPLAHRVRTAILLSRLSLGIVPHGAEFESRALELARTALRLAPRDEMAYYFMSWAYGETGRLEDAVAACERGLEINPNCTLILSQLGASLAPLGRPREAIEACRLALRLNPRDPSNFWRHSSIAIAHFVAGDYEAALQESKRVARSRPFLQGGIIWAASAAALEKADEARAGVEYCLAQRPDLKAGAVVPGILLRFSHIEDHERLLALLRKAGLPD